ncbi:hypothetical protein K402DRAFT_233621 [Aulographum hederae CBS 113979]|uniref:Transcription factor BYE1 n=1 Tax=Aulographum hederae CBS 113979 TaxID=1176131 RepID=A0A6G1GKV0_9PEZI|nr:hypothetical protein K402DRAFT_233621 [Aulographum hederae CBS 113979]
MAEPRRSGRATKGQHKALEEPENPTTPAPAKAPKKGKKDTKSAEPEPEDEDEEGEDDSIVRCICGATKDDGGRMMICCEQCEAWQHNECMGVTTNEDELESVTFYCEQCRPEQYQDLLAAMARGEKPWEAGKKKTASSPAPPQPTATPQPTEPTNKRKRDSAEDTNGNGEKPAPKAAPEKRRKSSHNADASSTRPIAADGVASTIEELPKQRRPATAALQKDISEHLRHTSRAGSFRIPDGHTADSLGAQIALQIEHALTVRHGEGPDYSAQFRTIIFNVKKNTTLKSRLIQGSLKADELATMSSNDMANEELQKQMAVMKEESDKQAILLQDDRGPRIRKTHKGDELVEDDSARSHADDFVPPPIRRPSSMAMEGVESTAGASSERIESPRTDLPDGGVNSPLSIQTSQPSAAESRGPASASNFNINNVWSSVRSPDVNEQRLLQQQPLRRQSSSLNVQTGPGEDAEVDRLLRDDEQFNDPYAGASGGGDPGATPWDGRMEIAAINADFAGTARYMGGGEIHLRMPYPQLLPPTLEITGRLHRDRGNEYCRTMRYSAHYDIGLLALSHMDSDLDKANFDKIWNYFHEKERWGVVRIPDGHPIRDLYVIPIEAGAAPLPEFFSQLEVVNLESPRPENMMILAVAARMAEPKSAEASPHSDNGNGNRPLVPTPVQQSHVSPVAGGSPATFGNGQVMPPYPYGPPQPPQPAQAPALQPRPRGNTPPPSMSLAERTLGPFMTAPVVLQMMSALPDCTEVQLLNLRFILETSPECRTDWAKFTAHLREVNSRGVAA